MNSRMAKFGEVDQVGDAPDSSKVIKQRTR